MPGYQTRLAHRLQRVTRSSPLLEASHVSASYGATLVLEDMERGDKATLERVRGYVAVHFPKDLPVRLTGTLVLLTGTTSDIVAGQIESLSIALGVIFVVMSAMFLSTRIVVMSPQMGYTKPAPTLARTSRTFTVWPVGAPFSDESALMLRCVLAMHTGRLPNPLAS